MSKNKKASSCLKYFEAKDIDESVDCGFDSIVISLPENGNLFFI